MADNRQILMVGVTNQRTERFNPRQRVVHAHRTAHQTEAGEGAGIVGQRITGVNGDQLPRNRVRIEECGKIGRSL